MYLIKISNIDMVTWLLTDDGWVKIKSQPGDNMVQDMGTSGATTFYLMSAIRE